MIALLAASLAAVPADADSFTGRLDGLAQHCLLREGTFPAEPTPEEARRLKSLGKAITALLRPSTSAAGDLAVAAKVAKVLEGAFPGDAEFGADLDAALAGLRADHAAVWSRLYPYLERLPPGDPRQRRGYALLERVNALDAVSDGAEDRAGRAALLGKAVRTLDSAWKASIGAAGRYLVPASAGTAAASIGGVPFLPDFLLAKYYSEYGFLDFALVEQAPAGELPLRLIEVRVRGVQGPGSYLIRSTDLGITFPQPAPSGVVVDCPGEAACVGFGTEVSGTYTGVLTVTTLDLERRLVEGTFSFLAKEPAPGTGTRSITGGNFRTGVRLQTKPVRVQF